MDGPVLDQIRASDSFSQKTISLSESSVNSRNGESEPETDLKLDVDASNECTLSGVNEHLGSGTNAVSKTNMIINVGTSPLSELVWSPHKGLRLKYTDYSLLENKSSILWCTDLARMIVCPSECVETRSEENNNNDVAVDGILSVTPSSRTSSLKEEIYDGKIPALLSESNLDSVSMSKLRFEERSSRVAGKNWPAETKAGEVNLDVKDKMIFPQETKADMVICDNKTDVNGGLSDKNSVSGVDDCIITDPTFKQEDSRSGLAPIMLKGGVPFEKNGDKYCGTTYASGPSAMLSSEVYAYKNCNLIEKPVSDPITDMNKKSANCSNILNADRPSASTEHILEILEAEKKEERGISTLVSMKIVESSPCKRKDRGESSSDTGGNSEKDDSHESVESCNSGCLYASGKRAWTSERQSFVKNKNMKQNQSFVNWVSCVANGKRKIKKDEKPLSADLVTSSQLYNGGHDSLTLSSNDSQVCAGSSTGFGKFFESLYNKRSRLLNENTGEGFNKFERPEKVFSTNRNFHSANDERNFEMRKKNSVDHHPCLNGLENRMNAVGQPSSSYDKTEELSKSGKSSSTSLFEDKCCSPDVKKSNEVGSVDPLLLVNSTNTSDGLHQNIWISRFRPIVLNPEQSNMIMDKPVNNLINSCSLLSPNHGQSNKESSYEPSSEDQGIVLSRKVEDCPLDQADSCGLKQTNGDQKFKAKLSPILPSQKLRSAEDIASIFARRLDTLKHITPSKARGDMDMTTICFFCGMRGHTLLDCSEILESELEDLLSNHRLYDGSEDASCLCIRCFRLNHWAVACPHTSSKEPINGSHIRLRTWQNSLPKSPIVDPDSKSMRNCGNKVESLQPSHSCPILRAENSRLGKGFSCSSDDE